VSLRHKAASFLNNETMSNRRNFIKTTAIASVAMALNSFKTESEEDRLID